MIQINSDQQSQEAASVGAHVCAEDRPSIKVLDSSNGDGDFQKVWSNRRHRQKKEFRFLILQMDVQIHMWKESGPLFLIVHFNTRFIIHEAHSLIFHS